MIHDSLPGFIRLTAAEAEAVFVSQHSALAALGNEPGRIVTKD